MKRAKVLVSIVLGGSMAVAVAAQQPPAGGQGGRGPQGPPVAEIQKVADNLYLITGGGGNTAAFITANGVVLVDTKLANWGQAIMDKVKTVTDKPVTTIVNTHTHGDHTGSNEFFANNVEVVTHENTKANMERMEALKGKPNAMPDRTYKDRLTLGRGNDQVDLYYFGPGHTNGDTIVVFPALRTMHTGDLFPGKVIPFVDTSNGGQARPYPETLEKASKGIRNVDTIIPGHSTLMKWADLTEFIEFNRELGKLFEAAHHAGKTPEQAAKELQLPAKFSSYATTRAPEYAKAYFAEMSR